MAFLTTPYSIVTWLYVNTNVDLIDYIHNIMHKTYEPFSLAVVTMLIIVSILPRQISDVISSNCGVDFIVNFISRRFKVCFESTKGGIQ